MSSLKLKQSRNGYASQISSSINKLNNQLALSSSQFDEEYTDYLLSKLDSCVDAISEITQRLVEISSDEDKSRHVDYLAKQKFKVYEIKLCLNQRRPEIANPSARYDEPFNNCEEDRNGLKDEIDEQLEQEMAEMMSANKEFMEKVSEEIKQLTPAKRETKMSTQPSKEFKPVESTLTKEPTDSFIDNLIEGEETVLEYNHTLTMSSLLVIKHEFESRSLPTIELMKFNGDASKWPEFITNFKNRVHIKSTFTDDLRMERLLSCLQGEAARAIQSIGISGLFYATALKTLKRDFGNPAVVSHLKLKSILDKPQIASNDRISLRQYQQQLKSTITWLKSIGYTSYLSSTDVLTRAVMRLPIHLRQSFFKTSRKHNFTEGETTLMEFESWLSDKLLEYFNPIANLISSHEEESKLRKKPNIKELIKTNYQHQSMVTSPENNFIPSEKVRVSCSSAKLKCWLCSQNHRLQDCNQFLSESTAKRKDTVIKLKLCWNCLSNNHFSKDCSSQNRCRVDQCNRRHHTLLHHFPEGSSFKNRNESPKSASTQAFCKSMSSSPYPPSHPTISSNHLPSRQVSTSHQPSSASTHAFSQPPSASTHAFSQPASASTHAFSQPASASTHTFSQPPSASTHTFSQPPPASTHAFSQLKSASTPFNVASSNQASSQHMKVSINHRQSKQSRAILQVIPVQVSNGIETFSANALLDSGSDATLIRKDLADSLYLRGKKESIRISNVLSNASKIDSKRVSFFVSTSSHPDQIEVNDAWVVQNLNLSTEPLNIEQLKASYPHLRNIYIEHPVVDDVTILIGADMPELLLHQEYRKGQSHEPVAVRTKLGWVLFGGGKSETSISTNLLQHKPDVLHQSVERFWSIESYGTTKYQDTSLMSTNEQRAMSILKETTKKSDGQYHIGMLWNRDDSSLPNNRIMAVKRLLSIEKRLDRDPHLSTRYHDAMNDYIRQGHARKLDPIEISNTSLRTNYVPHHCVFNPNKPKKLRIVFDAAATFAGTSLNENLLVGPDLLNNLITILLHFRLGKISVMSDIKQMFNQVKAHLHDQDSLRFLWRNNAAENIDEYVMTVHLFGKRDSPTVASYALKRSGWDEASNFNSKVIDAIENNFYMDDYLDSFDTSDEAIETANNLIRCLALSHFHLTKWVSNSKAVMESIQTKERLNPHVCLDISNSFVERTLGIIWNTDSDTLQVSSVSKSFPNTKRGVLSFVSSIFDPLGFVVPSVLEPKFIIQELWRRRIDWDETLPSDLLIRWKQWRATMASISELSISRWYGANQSSYQELHIFADASEKAYGAVAYLKILSKSITSVSFVIAKSRLAPLKNILTIPKLELQAAVTAVRLKESILQGLQIPDKCVFLWSDSTTVLKYIRNEDRRFPTFVMHRVNEIRQSSRTSSWKYVPGLLNPADHCTRYSKFSDLLYLPNWFEGPSFLHQPEFNFGKFENNTSEDATEVDNVNLNAASTTTTSETSMTSNVINWQRFSSFKRLARTIAWIVRFKEQWISNHRPNYPTVEPSDVISAKDIMTATKYLCRIAQQESFNISSSKAICDKSLTPLRPIISDDGLLRVGGRLKNAQISPDERHPIILHHKHPLSVLIVQHYHVSNFHAGREHTLGLVRQLYWIIKARSVIRHVIHACLFCERRRVTPTSPTMSDLPIERLAINEAPFTYTGIDYFGPMVVKLTKKTRSNQRTSKRYGVLFTCLTVRAVHLELANDLSTDSFILASRRFCARRGNPKLFWTDNGTNFIGANNELKEAIKELDQKRINDKFTDLGITWKFNPPSSPWMGGIWEALVKIVKRALKVVI